MKLFGALLVALVACSGGAPATEGAAASGVFPLSAYASLPTDGGRYRVVVSNSLGSDTSRAATLTVTPNQVPTAHIHIDAGLTNGKFIAGQQITFSGTATDPEDGDLGASAFTWKVEYITSINTGHPAVRPFVPEFSGQADGNFTPATTGPYNKADVAYRITLTVTDSGGLSRTIKRDVAPNVAPSAFG